MPDNQDNIFVSPSYGDTGTLSGKVTYTNMIETIPEDSTEQPLVNWKRYHKIEWRWRFLNLPNERQVVEISFVDAKDNVRIYFTKRGDWSKKNVPDSYDKFVEKVYYYYSNK